MLGPHEFAEVIISTISPLFSTWSIVTILPFTLAPTHLQPICVCILKAKSRGVAPAGNSMTSPLGVKTNTCLVKRSILRVSINSLESTTSFCHSKVCLNQASFISSASSEALDLPSLYFQCAAIPYSASSCIFFVLIWTSKGLPILPITVVWIDWYIFIFGIAI